MSPYDDDKFVAARLVRGDERAFEEFFENYFPRLYRFALSRLDHDADAAEEVVQATLATAVAKIATYRGEAALFTWLCTFCRHEISAYVDRRRRRVPETPLVEDAPETRAALESLGRAVDGPDENLRRRELAALVTSALDALPARYAAVLELKYLQDLTVDEIALRLTTTPKAVESVLSRARDAFRDAVAALRVGRTEWER
jgi:RNA polymerase sigma-70 factor (ECF subfamily)